MHFDWIHIGALFLVVLVAGVTALGVFLVWRRGFVKGWRAARSDSPTCPNCRYDLKGLSHCRCPECGTEYRLDELWRSAVIPDRVRPSDSVQETREPTSQPRSPQGAPLGAEGVG